MVGRQISFTWYEPATVLELAAAQLGRPLDRRVLEDRLARAADPHSLLTLVQVAAECGFEVKAFRSEGLAALEGSALPLLVHVQNPLDEADRGFALATGRDRQGFLLASADGVRWRLEWGELDRLWTGVLATIALRPAPVPAPASGARSSVESLSTTTVPSAPAVDLVPGRCARWVASIAAPVLAALGALHSGLDGDPGQLTAGLVSLLWTGLAVAGFAASRALAARAHELPPAGAPVCQAERSCAGTGGVFGCDGALSSRWAAPLGLDLSAMGIAFFSATVLVMAAAALLPGAQRSAHAALGLAHVLAVPASLLLVVVQIYPLRRLCALCLCAHAAILGGAAAGAFLARPAGWHGSGVIGFLLLFALVFVAARGVLAPFLALAETNRAAQERLGAIASTVVGGLAEWLGRPLLLEKLPASPFTLGSSASPLRLDALVDPACPACHGVLAELERLIEDHFDEVHAFVHLPTRDLRDPSSRAVRVALTAAGRVDAYHDARDRPDELPDLVARGATAVLEHFGESPARLEEARVAQAAADQLALLVDRTTPTFLVNGRLWLRPLWELAVALSHHRPQLGLPEADAHAAKDPSSASDDYDEDEGSM